MANRAFVLQKLNEVSFETRDKPVLKHSRQVLVHVEQTGICGSDVHYWKAGRIGKYVVNGPMVLGHESSGTVVEVGDEVPGLKPGDRVAMEPGIPCRYCDLCKSGLYNHCDNMEFAATPPVDGTLQTYYPIDYDLCYKIPDHMSFEEGAMIEPVSVAVQICKRGQVQANDSVLVFGCGPIGLLCQSVAKAYGCRKVIGVDISQGRLDFAAKYSCDGVFKPSAKLPEEDSDAYNQRVSKELCDKFNVPNGFDVILEASGAEPCMQLGVYAARPQARFVQAGMGREFCNFPVTAALIKELNWTGSIRYTTGVYPTAVELVSSGQINVKPLVTNRFSFDQAEEAFNLVHSRSENVIKVIIEGAKA